jgi:tRNA (guanine37-N1)-methyltransferase
MTTPCVRAPVTDGEPTRAALADEALLDPDREIAVEDGTIYIPIVDGVAARDAGYDVVERETSEREGQTMPAEVLGVDPSYERLGDVVLVDEDDPDTAGEIADAIMESDIPVRSVLNRDSKVKGETRVRDWEVLADEGENRPPTETVHREYGHEFAVDVAEVYFSPRLATERNRVVEQVEPGEQALDMFAGAGPYAIPMADAGAEVVACDINPEAIEYLRENAERNGVADRITAHVGDVRELTDEYADWADRLVMNLPHTAAEFADAAVAFAGESCVVHLYDIQHEDGPFDRAREALESAAGDEYEVTTLEERVVRSYAPHELNVCLDARLDRID